DASVPILGGYRGQLSNEGERVQLQRPDVSPPDEPEYVPHLIEDEVDYAVGAPWPAEAAGVGMSLHRAGGQLWGNDATSWTAAAPTPGSVSLATTAEVVGRYVFYNDSAFDGDDPAAGAEDDNAIATDKTALLPGGTATFANYTSYSRGINGIMVDIAGLPAGDTLDADDFAFRVG
ncbi:MAG: hypothetical protein GTO22_05815, partial [Gemmatimonadales bacterium]|nr:hypothetical protein [Gemmatimonadales bacterium]